MLVLSSELSATTAGSGLSEDNSLASAAAFPLSALLFFPYCCCCLQDHSLEQKSDPAFAVALVFAQSKLHLICCRFVAAARRTTP
jgi:hypothetical protein